MVETLLDPELLKKSQEILQEKFKTECKITSAELLSKPDRRNVIARIWLQSASSSVPKSVILKQALPRDSDTDDKDAFARFARDWAGLEFASKIQQSIHNVPQFYGADRERRFILIEDLGDPHVSLVDSLTASNPENAVAALERYIKALGSFHAASFKHTNLYEEILMKINKDADTPQKELEVTSEKLMEKLSTALSNKKLALPITGGFKDEVHKVLDGIFNPAGPFTVLTHGDIAPDNVFDHLGAKGLQLIDFELCGIRNALLDGTYLRMSIPTGWCAKKIPDDIIKHVEQIYRSELMRGISAESNVNDAAYNLAYTQACAFHALQQMATINKCLEKNETWSGGGPDGPVPPNCVWDASKNFLRPRFLSRLQAFIDVASEHKMFPCIREMAEDMLARIKLLWPDATPLDVYPAFHTPSLQAKPSATDIKQLGASISKVINPQSSSSSVQEKEKSESTYKTPTFKPPGSTD